VIFLKRAATFLKDMLLMMMAIWFFSTGWLFAQQPRQAPANAPPLAGGLKIAVLEGQNGVNNIRMPMSVDLVVEVRDENDRPLEGATVNFQMPLMGPSGGFEGGVRNKETTSNVQGQAAVSYTPNEELGRFTVQVKAVQGGRTGMTTIMQQNANTSEAGQTKGWFSRHKKIVIAAAVLAVGVGLAVGLTRGGSKSGSSGGSGLTISPGVPTVAGPQ
jgi:hypothetical protein